MCTACRVTLCDGSEIGLGPIVWVLLSEMYPLAVRGVAMSVGATANWIFTFVVGLLFPVVNGWYSFPDDCLAIVLPSLPSICILASVAQNIRCVFTPVAVVVFVSDALGISAVFYIYGAMGIAGALFIHKFVPETRGRTLEEVSCPA